MPGGKSKRRKRKRNFKLLQAFPTSKKVESALLGYFQRSSS
jgi:hypothetical protein